MIVKFTWLNLTMTLAAESTGQAILFGESPTGSPRCAVAVDNGRRTDKKGARDRGACRFPAKPRCAGDGSAWVVTGSSHAGAPGSVFRGRLGECSRDELIDRTPAHFGLIVSVLIPPHANVPEMVAHRRLSLTQEMEACSLYTGSNRTLRELADRYGLSPAGVLARRASSPVMASRSLSRSPRFRSSGVAGAGPLALPGAATSQGARYRRARDGGSRWRAQSRHYSCPTPIRAEYGPIRACFLASAPGFKDWRSLQCLHARKPGFMCARRTVAFPQGAQRERSASAISPVAIIASIDAS
jgi:hypothetical protein